MKIQNTFTKYNFKNFTGTKSVENKAQHSPELSPDDIEYFVYCINSILSKPIKERSNHLMHEYNPNTGSPILGKFKLKAEDGAIITVARSITKKGSDSIKYLAITVEKKHTKNTIRIDLSNNNVIKSGLEDSFYYDERLKYYNRAELNRLSNLKEILSYLPEITKIQNDKRKKPIKKSTIKTMKSSKAIEMEVLNRSSIVNRESQLNDSCYISSQPIKLLNSPLIYSRQAIEVTLKRLGNVRRLEQNPNIISIDRFDELAYIENICRRYLEYKKSLSRNASTRFINGEISSYVDKTSGSNVSITLNNFDGENKARFSIMPFNDLLRILILDKDKKIIRGYLIKDKDKIVSNYNLNTPTVVPKVFIYSHNTQSSEQSVNMLRKDIEEIAQKMHYVDKILSKIEKS